MTPAPQKTTQKPQERAIYELAEPVCAAHGVELVEVRQVTARGATVLRVTIDRPRPASDERQGSGVTLEDCTSVSRDLSTALDVHDVITGKFHLEVSSPGLDRPLVKPEDYKRFVGFEVKIKCYAPIEGRRNFSGILLGLDDELVELEQDDSKFRIPLEAIAKANLVPKL